MRLRPYDDHRQVAQTDSSRADMNHSIFPPNTLPNLPPNFSSLLIQGPYPPSAPIHLCLSHLQSGPKSNKPVLISPSSKHLVSQLEGYNDAWLHKHAMDGAVAEDLHQIDIFYPQTHKHLRLLLARLRTYSTPSSEADTKTCITRVPTLLILHELSEYFLVGDDPELPTLSTYMQLVIDAIACLTFLGKSSEAAIRSRLVLFDTNLVNLTLPFFQPVLLSEINQVPTNRKVRTIEGLKKVIGWIGTVERVDEIPSSQADETELVLASPTEVEKEHYRFTLGSTTSAETDVVHWYSFRDLGPGPFSAIRTTRVRFG
ncbi:unnamed protein product [Rhizoctonia solani]|uniref:Uncharacterized protein n=1 Tax=Rhizoctonia solani TaxID=456999 RepID=A0A8H2X009_9AGAM|nr:unnamed protein product [Rhizoctonia solani]